MNTCSWFFAALNGKAFLARFPCSKLMLETLVVTYQLAFLTPDFDSVDHQRGMDITFVTTANTDEEAKALLDAFGFPFKK